MPAGRTAARYERPAVRCDCLQLRDDAHPLEDGCGDRRRVGRACLRATAAGGGDGSDAVRAGRQARWAHAQLWRRWLAVRSRRAVFHRTRPGVCRRGGCVDRARRRGDLACARRQLGWHRPACVAQRVDALCRGAGHGRTGACACSRPRCSVGRLRAVTATQWRHMAVAAGGRRDDTRLRYRAAGGSGAACGCLAGRPRPTLATLAATARMQPAWAVVLRFDLAVDPGYDALFVNAGPVRWVARNSSKPGRAGVETWLLHATADWSQAHLDATPEAVIASLLPALAALGLPPPHSCDAYRWTVASTEPALQIGCAWEALPGIGICGDCWPAARSRGPGKAVWRWQRGCAPATPRAAVRIDVVAGTAGHTRRPPRTQCA